MRIIYDIETYPNCFTLSAEHADMPLRWAFEISPWRDDRAQLWLWLLWLRGAGAQMVGFNNVSFDYGVLHLFCQMQGKATHADLYQKAMQIIQSRDDEDKFAHTVFPSDRFVDQIDLFKLHHFDNKAKMTSLKALEFNMRLDSVEDLPFPVGTVLTREQIEVLHDYNAHDIRATKTFYLETLPMIEFREQLSAKHGKDFLNHNDTKIGAEIFQMALEKAGVPCYEYGPAGRQPRQTLRPILVLKDAILPWIELETPEFKRILDWLRNQSIIETKGVFKDIKATLGGLEFVFGTGGLHAAVESEVFIADDQMVIESKDVSSYYPNLAIKNRFYPEHLTEKFCDIYQDLYEQRKQFKKGTAENAALKLALNGSYGKSNDKFSIFYDPLFTLKITLNGQLLLCLLIENLMKIPTLRMAMVNTDGLEYTIHPDYVGMANKVCDWWMSVTKLELESARYSKLFIRDCNNYIGEYVKGGVKRKGRYEWDVEWHQDASALVVPKVAEQVLLEGVPIRTTVENWPDRMDFMCRVKIPRSSTLWGSDGRQLPNMLRYYVAKDGVTLTKILPPLAKNPGVPRHFAVVKGHKVCPCNNIADATMDIDFDYYVREVEKLCLGMK